MYNNLINSDFSTNQKNGTDASLHKLALATHTSINNLHPLDSLVERWQNPLSVAIFAHGQDATFATALVYTLSIFCPQWTSTWCATPGRWRVSLNRNGSILQVWRIVPRCSPGWRRTETNTRTMPSGVRPPIQTIFFRTLPAT